MREDKARGDKFLNKDEKYEVDYIVNQYPKENRVKIRELIRRDDLPNYSTHDEVYKYLKTNGYYREQ